MTINHCYAQTVHQAYRSVRKLWQMCMRGRSLTRQQGVIQAYNNIAQLSDENSKHLIHYWLAILVFLVLKNVFMHVVRSTKIRLLRCLVDYQRKANHYTN